MTDIEQRLTALEETLKTYVIPELHYIRRVLAHNRLRPKDYEVTRENVAP